MNVSASRVRLLKVWEILLHYSSEEHPLKTNELIDLLVDVNQYCDRRTVYGDVALLIKTGHYVCKTHKDRSNQYYTPNKLNTSSMEEILYLIDNSEYDEKKKIALKLQFINTVLD